MKYLILTFIIAILSFESIAQLHITPGAIWTNNGNITITLNDLDFYNNGLFNADSSVCNFSGNVNNIIGGNSPTTFFDIRLSKQGSNKMSLQQNSNINHIITFNGGLFDLNQHTLSLATNALLVNENENSRITGLNGGEVTITQNLNAPQNGNPGNLGAIISCNTNLGNVTISRGHKTQTGIGLSNSINRYFDIQCSNSNSLNANLQLNYFNAELNGLPEQDLTLFNSANSGTNWLNQGSTNSNTSQNFVSYNGLSSLNLFTLSIASTPLPVTLLNFYTLRINEQEVELKWQTSQEHNNRGFSIERKLENENDFSSVGFENSSAINGNSDFNLSYNFKDQNNFKGITQYRLKQVDIDGRYVYSIIRTVNGVNSNTMKLQVWPVPATNFFNASIDGIDKTDHLIIYDMQGKMIKYLTIENQTTQQVYGLPSGNYIVTLESDKSISQKVIVNQ